ncbi:MAG: ceramidase domain-containing protein [Gammaproteobacteria bacterium]
MQRVAAYAILIATLVVVAFAVTEPVAQDPAYHAFADNRRLFHVDNFWNVASNLPFLLIGAWGVVFVSRLRESVCSAELRPAYTVFFAGILLTAFGSGLYHLAPGNGTLILDRLPMTIGFAGLFAIIVGEFVSLRAARALLLSMLAIGVGSVLYWAVTEASGAGDLRPYAVVQFLPMLLVPVFLLRSRLAQDLAPYVWLMIGCYAVAKVFEHFDAAIFSAGNLLSGHTLKHLFASLTPAVLLFGLIGRRHAACNEIPIARD